jgi:hypothetical protein
VANLFHQYILSLDHIVLQSDAAEEHPLKKLQACNLKKQLEDYQGENLYPTQQSDLWYHGHDPLKLLIF